MSETAIIKIEPYGEGSTVIIKNCKVKIQQGTGGISEIFVDSIEHLDITRNVFERIEE